MSVEPTVELPPDDPSVAIQTPEGVPVSFVLATGLERGLAYALDLLFSQIATFVLVLVLLLAAAATLSEHLVAIALVGLFLFRYLYFFVLETRYQGATPGKRILGLRVVRRDGGPLELQATLARTVLRELEVTLPVAVLSSPEQFLGRAPVWLSLLAVSWLAIVLLLPFFSSERTRAGDLVAGTVVVRVPQARMQEDEAESHAVGRIRFTAAHLSHYGETELETLAELLRAIDGGRAEPEALRRVADAICGRIGVSPKLVGDEPEQFLRDFYRAQRTELERSLVLGDRIADKHDRSERGR